jgi:hypothetical protein
LQAKSKQTFQWNRSAGAQYYNILIETLSGSSWRTYKSAKVNDSACIGVSPAECSYAITTNLPSSFYRWSVQAYGVGAGAWSKLMYLQVPPPPATPQEISPIYGANFNPNTGYFTWNSVFYATHYRLMIKQGSTTRYLNLNDILAAGTVCPGAGNGAPGTCSVALKDLKTSTGAAPILPSGTGYVWSVQAWRDGDNVASPWSKGAKFVIQ